MAKFQITLLILVYTNVVSLAVIKLDHINTVIREPGQTTSRQNWDYSQNDRYSSEAFFVDATELVSGIENEVLKPTLLLLFLFNQDMLYLSCRLEKDTCAKTNTQGNRTRQETTEPKEKVVLPQGILFMAK